MALSARPFRPDEAGIAGALRLEALADAPEAFAESLEAASAAGGEDFSRFLEAGLLWGAFDAARCVGMAGLDRWVGANVEHRATLWGVYVSPAARGLRAGQALLTGVVGHAATIGVEIIELGVGDVNTGARRLYESLGFTPYGLQRRAVKWRGRYTDEVLMALRVGQAERP